MLLAVAAQATAGLFTTDDVVAEGPLQKFASAAVAARAGAYHAKGIWIIAALAAVHILANASYEIFGRDRVVTAMVTGLKPALAYDDPSPARLPPAGRAAACAALSIAIVAVGVTLAGDSLLS